MSWRKTGTITIVVVEARNLANKRFFSKQESHCILYYNRHSQRTRTVRGGIYPQWDEEIRFPVHLSTENGVWTVQEADSHLSRPSSFHPPDQTRKRALRLSCYSYSPTNTELIGECLVDLTVAMTKGEMDEWFTLRNNRKYTGEIYLEITFKSEMDPQSALEQPIRSKSVSQITTKLPKLITSPFKSSLLTPESLLRPRSRLEDYSSDRTQVLSPEPSTGFFIVPPSPELKSDLTKLAVVSLDDGMLTPAPSPGSYVVFRGHSEGLPSGGQNLAWDGDLKDFQFLNAQSVCNPSLIGAFKDWVVSASSEVLLFTLPSRVIIYHTGRDTVREIHYGFRIKSIWSVAHSLSPDGKILVRWMIDKGRQTGIISAIDARSKQQVAQLPRRYRCHQRDLSNAKWVDATVIYIPVTAEGIVVCWNVHEAAPRNTPLLDISTHSEDPLVIQPLASITQHSVLKFDITKDKKWWTATGITPRNPPSGLIEVHDVENDESRIVHGMVSCITEVDVYDKEKALLIIADIVADSKLQIRVQQMNPRDSGQPFVPVDVKVDLLEENDYPRDIIVLYPLPIVAILTEEGYSYFFELHTGAYLFSQSQKPYRLCPGYSDKRGILMWSHEESDVRTLTVNEGDLIGYCRQVLKNDMLASTIAVRTGLPGAEDIILNDMLGHYQDVSSRR